MTFGTRPEPHPRVARRGERDREHAALFFSARPEKRGAAALKPSLSPFAKSCGAFSSSSLRKQPLECDFFVAAAARRIY